MGRTYSGVGIDRAAVDVEIVFSQHLGTFINSSARAIEHSSQHVFGDTNLQAVAGELDFGLLLRQYHLCHATTIPTFLTSMPDVPSNTCTTALLPARLDQSPVLYC